MGTGTDWEKIRAEYISGHCTYTQLAQKYGTTKGAVGSRAQKEGWYRQRAAFRQSVASRALNKAKDVKVAKLERLMNAADRMSELMERITADKAQFYRQYIAGTETDEETGTTRAIAYEYVTQKADMRALKNATAALNELTRAVRNLYDLPTGEEQRDRKLAERKMRLAERREGADQTDGGGVIEIAAILPEQPDGQEVDV